METTQIPFQSLSASDTRFLVAYLAAQGDIVSFAKAANLKLQEAVQWAFSPHINNALNQLHEMQTVEFQAAATAAKHTCIQILTSTLTQIVEFHEKNKDDPALRTKASARFGTLLRALSLLARVSGFKLSTSPAASPRAAKPKLDDPKAPPQNNWHPQTPRPVPPYLPWPPLLNNSILFPSWAAKPHPQSSNSSTRAAEPAPSTRFQRASPLPYLEQKLAPTAQARKRELYYSHILLPTLFHSYYLNTSHQLSDLNQRTVFLKLPGT